MGKNDNEEPEVVKYGQYSIYATKEQMEAFDEAVKKLDIPTTKSKIINMLIDQWVEEQNKKEG